MESNLIDSMDIFSVVVLGFGIISLVIVLAIKESIALKNRSTGTAQTETVLQTPDNETIPPMGKSVQKQDTVAAVSPNVPPASVSANTPLTAQPLSINSTFASILQRIVAERSFSIFDNLAKCKSLLQDYTAGEYKKESRLLLIAIEAGCPGEIARSTEPEITRRKLVNKLVGDFSLNTESAEQIIEILHAVSGKK